MKDEGGRMKDDEEAGEKGRRGERNKKNSGTTNCPFEASRAYYAVEGLPPIKKLPRDPSVANSPANENAALRRVCGRLWCGRPGCPKGWGTGRQAPAPQTWRTAGARARTTNLAESRKCKAFCKSLAK